MENELKEFQNTTSMQISAQQNAHLQNDLEKLKTFVWKWLRKAAADVTLDPVTANLWLILSKDKKQVRLGNTQQDLPDNPQRFSPVVSVLGKEGFSSGRHYWEVQVGDKTDWALGVARESVNRKGKNSLSPNNGYWTILLNNGNEYKALADSSVSINLSVKPQKVGVYVDYEEGQVSFYSVETRSHIYTFTGYKFTEKLYPYFSPFLSNNGTNSGPLIITSVSPIA
ncbi:zinc-binding protein A33-like [Scleropages formosus]|uniref:zinc-binding protein A33-like n=1 Tax=Scleropages formosus TaxID=113540 RepID=UPI0010FA8744|nr:zinc-binding protein A33-like [Scleropages formosus]